MLVLAACGGTDPACVISAVTVSPPSGSVGEDETLNLTASVEQANCGAVSISWQSLTPSTASVVGSGTLASVTGLASGSANIVALATAGNVSASGSANITVTPAPIGTITITPPAATVQAGQTQALTVELRSARNRVLTGRTVTWSSSNDGVATVSGSGANAIVSARTVGAAIISASSEGRSTSAAIQVTPAPPASITVTPASSQVTTGRTTQLQAEVKDAAGNVLTNVSISWTSADPATASVTGSGNSATVTGNQVGGPVRITASAGNVSGFANVTVINIPVANVLLTPTTLGLTIGGSASLTARTVDATGVELFGRAVTWASSNASVASVSGSGGTVTITGVAVGQATITATSEGRAATATVTVSSIPVAGVTVQAASNQITVTGTTTATATTTDANGTVLTGRAISWQSSNAAVASVSGSGNTVTVTGVGAGSATITATSEGQSGSVVITVANVSTVIVAPHKLSLPMVGASTSALALQLDGNGNPQAGVNFAWSSSNTGVASVNGSGLIVATGVGTVTITATRSFNGLTSSVTVEVFSEYDFIPCFIKCYSRSIAVETWAQAKTRAARFGGLLASINSAGEQTHLNGQRGGAQVWLGLTDAVLEGRFVFEDDALASPNAPWFSAWSFGQPDPSPNPENCALMEAPNGLWHDFPCTFQAKSFMEWGFQNFTSWITDLAAFNGHRYAVTTHAMAWPQAQVLATMMGGHLVKIETLAENNFLQSRYGAGDPWIGLNDRAVAGTQRWHDGTLPTFLNWGGVEPNHSPEGNPAQVENCTQILAVDGKWNDFWCRREVRAIIEWDTLK
jgi:uncharacterized protein YjdB